jgi:hypothetical protein
MKYIPSLILSLVLVPRAHAVAPAQGGGIANAGLFGDYFANEKLADKPAFTRKEVRIRFDWGDKLPIGGSIAEPYKSFPHDGFSARWTGKVIPRFSEGYRFRLNFDAGARLFIRLAGSTRWTPLVDQWDRTGDVIAPAYGMKAGQQYEVKLEYHHHSGPANIQLRWSSPSTPEEVIEPVVDSGLNLASWAGSCFADRIREGQWWRPTASTDFDQQGWPKTDCEFMVSSENKPNVAGAYQITFNGKAELRCNLFAGTFFADGETFEGKAPSGTGYDATTNTTTVMMKTNKMEGHAWLQFRNTSRDGSATTGTGITNLHIMRPIALGSDTPHAMDEISYRPMKPLIEAFTNIRWLQAANVRNSGKWEDRTPATWPKFTKPSEKGEPNHSENLESLILLANETGRDLYLTTPVEADDDYLTNLAKLLKYGSDGVRPYDSPEANPKFPPLNSNLCAYIEIGNEIWNWAFSSTGAAQDISYSEVQKQTPVGKIINYDGKATKGIVSLRRWLAARTVQASETFHKVYGDEAFGQRFRPLLEFMYANGQQTAAVSFDFLDAYYNNGEGDFVKQPHPANYYIWGGGGAGYYGVGNGEGAQDESVFADGSFDKIAVPDGPVAARPAGSAWKFSGDAGIVRPLNSIAPGYESNIFRSSPAKWPGRVDPMRIPQDTKTAMGCKFRTGPQPIWVHSLGRLFTSANTGATYFIIRESDNAEIARSERGRIGGFLIKYWGYFYGKPLEKPVRLEPNTTYYLLALLKGTGSAFASTPPLADSGPGVKVLNSVKATVTDPAKPESWDYTDGEPGANFGPVTFLYSMKESPTPDLPQPPFGQQAGILRGNSELSTTVTFAKPGDYALTFNAVTQKLKLQIFVDDQNVSPREQSDHRPCDPGGFAKLSGFNRNYGIKEEWGSAPFKIEKAGPHTVKFVTTGEEANYVMIDQLEIASVDAIMDSGFGAGSALGQPVEQHWETSQATDSSFVLGCGINRVSYETGWSLGGDFYQKPIQNYAKFSPRAENANDQAITMLERSGCRNPVWGVYIYWPPTDFANGLDYPVMKSFVKASNQLPSEVDNGVHVPAVLTANNAIKWHKNLPDLTERGKFLNWIVTVQETADYSIHVNTSGNGRFDLDTDGQRIGEPFSTGHPVAAKVRLTKGVHGVRVRNLGGSITVEQVDVKLGK